MSAAPRDKEPTTSKGIDLITCPVCFGHTKLLGETVYCPHCNIVVSENLSDSLKTKVELIKETVVEKNVVDQGYLTAKRHLMTNAVTAGVILAIFLVFLFLGFIGYDYLKAIAYEQSGDYKQAATYYERSRFLVALPMIKNSIERANRLAVSHDHYIQGHEAFTNQQWQEAIFHFNLVDKDDVDYQRAQESKAYAQSKSE